MTGTIDPFLRGTLSNTASVTVPGSATDPDPTDNTATDTTEVTATADLSVTKTDGVTAVQPGTAVTYTIVVSNAGPSAAVGGDRHRSRAGNIDRRHLELRRDRPERLRRGERDRAITHHRHRRRRPVP